MKKVLFTATVDSHILQFHLPFLKLFKDNGYEVHVATNGNEKIPYCDVKHKISFERSPIKINNLKAINQLKKICEKEKFDIIHTHTPMGSVVTRLAAKKSRKRLGTRVIYTAHGFHFFKGASFKNWLLFYPVEKWLAKYTDTLILINKEDYELAVRKFSKRCKDIQYVPGVGIDKEKFDFKFSSKEKENLRKSIGISKDDFVMIYPAELSKRKRQIWLINSLSKFIKNNSNVHLILPGKDSLNNKCQKYAENLGLINQIHFLGYRNDIPKLLKISNIALSSANQEGLPVNIMEAMYTGLPIVASNCRGNRDLVFNNKNGYLVDLNDNNMFSKSVEKIYLKKNNFGDINKEIIKDYLLNKIIDEMKTIYFKKKRVIHFLSSNSYSGAENVVCKIIEKFNEKYEVYYCSPKGKIADTLKSKNINFIGINRISLFNLRRVLKKYNPDIIHAHDYKASFYLSFLNNNKLLLSHLHNNNPELKKISIKSILLLYIARKSKRILTVSNSVLNEYIFAKKIESKVECIGNPVSRNDVICKIKNKRATKKYDVCCVARITKQKNPFRFVDIINKVKNDNKTISCIWIGDGELRDMIQNYSLSKNCNNNIHFLGFKDNPYEYMNESKIFLLTSDWEGFGLVSFEALTLGLPCVCSNVGGLSGIVDNDCGKLCDNNSLDDYVVEINKLLKDKDYYKSKSKSAIEKSKKLDNTNCYFDIIKCLYEGGNE